MCLILSSDSVFNQRPGTHTLFSTDLFYSGGKDSCYNMMRCIAEGHQIVALANLRPDDNQGKSMTFFFFFYHSLNGCNSPLLFHFGRKQSDLLVLGLQYMNATIEKMTLALLDEVKHARLPLAPSHGL